MLRDIHGLFGDVKISVIETKYSEGFRGSTNTIQYFAIASSRAKFFSAKNCSVAFCSDLMRLKTSEGHVSIMTGARLCNAMRYQAIHM